MFHSDIESAASDWIARRDSGLSASEQADFEQWLSDPVQARVFSRHEQAWRIFSRPHAAGRAPEMMREIHRRIGRRRSRTMAAVSAASVFLITALLWRSFSPHESGATIGSISVPPTAHVIRQEQRILPDGSIVELKAGAEISINFTGTYRRVALLKGEAHFHVAKNKNRPFIVAVGDLEVRAVGTAFLVQRGDTRLEVLVTEGIVAVDRRSEVSTPDERLTEGKLAAPSSLATLGVGQRALIDLSSSIPALQVEVLNSAAIADQLAWRGPRLEFTGTHLSDAVALINQFNQIQIVVDDPALATLEVSGYFRADNADTFLRLIEQSLGVHGERKGDMILLRKTH